MALTDVELVVVTTFLNQIDAEMAQGALEAAEIESMVSADDAGIGRDAGMLGND